MVDVNKNGGLNKVAGRVMSACQDACTGTHCTGNLRNHFFLLLGIDHRANDRAFTHSVALDQCTRARNDAFDKCISDFALNIDAFRADAYLTRVSEAVLHGKCSRCVKISIGKHDQRILAAQFKNHAL